MKKILLKSVLVFLILSVLMSVVACSKETVRQGSSQGGKSLIKIGIVQIVEHPSLNSIRETIIKRMEEKGFKQGNNISLDYQNAQGDMTNLKTICQKFVSSKYDLIIAIATPSAQAAAGETSDIPIVFSACTDPIAAGIVTSLEKPGKNVTGTSDVISAEKNMELIKRITPKMKNVGVLYSSGETSALLVLKELKEYAKNNQINLIESTVTSTSEVQQATLSLIGKCDVIFAPTDNTIASSMPIVSKVAIESKIPVYAGADSMVKDGGLAGCGVNYEMLGKETADMVVEVLNGKNPGDMPVRTMKDMNIYINKEFAKEIGVTIPEDVIKEASQIFEKQ